MSEQDIPPAFRKRGFALLSPEARKAVSRSGGIAAHSVGTAHTWTSDEARAAGSKGGKTTHERRKAKDRVNAARVFQAP